MRLLAISLISFLLSAPTSGALRFDANGDYLNRTTNLPINTAYTQMGWFKLTSDRGTYCAFFMYGNGGVTEKEFSTGADGTIMSVWDGADEVTGTQLTVGVWYHLAVTYDGSNVRAYKDGVLDITNANANAPTTEISVTRTAGSEWLDGPVACVKIYSAVLSANEILNERRRCRPVRTFSLNTWLPMTRSVVASDALDFSGNGFNTTVNGTLTVEQGPPVSW